MVCLARWPKARLLTTSTHLCYIARLELLDWPRLAPAPAPGPTPKLTVPIATPGHDLTRCGEGKGCKPGSGHRDNRLLHWYLDHGVINLLRLVLLIDANVNMNKICASQKVVNWATEAGIKHARIAI